MLTCRTTMAAAVAGVLLVGLVAGMAEAQCFTNYTYSSYYYPATVYAAPVYVAPASAVVVAPGPVMAVPRPVYYSAPVYRSYYSAPVYRSYGYVNYGGRCYTRGYHGGHCRSSRSVSVGFGWRH